MPLQLCKASLQSLPKLFFPLRRDDFVGSRNNAGQERLHPACAPPSAGLPGLPRPAEASLPVSKLMQQAWPLTLYVAPHNSMNPASLPTKPAAEKSSLCHMCNFFQKVIAYNSTDPYQGCQNFSILCNAWPFKFRHLNLGQGAYRPQK